MPVLACQVPPLILDSIKAGAAHIAFTAPSRTAVRDFYTAALTAGGRPNGSPSTRCDEDGHFNAAVLDLDGNSIEVVYRNGPDMIEDGTVIEHSRVIKWQRSVHESWQSSRSSVSSHTAVSKRAPTEVMSVAPSVASKASSVASKPASVARSVSEPTVVSQTTSTSNQGDGVAKTIIGTLLGAAAGAAVAYAMVRSEQDSAKKEQDFGAFMDAKSTVKTAMGFLAGASSQPQQPTPDPQPAPPTLHRSIDVESYHSSAPSAPRSVVAPRMIEAAPSSYYAPAPSAVSPSHAQTLRALEYRTAPSAAPSKARSTRSVARSITSPELLTIERTRHLALEAKPESVISVSKTRSLAPSPAPSSFISSFVADEVPRRVNSEGSVASHQSSRSKARSSHSKHSRSSRHEEAIESSPSPPPPESRSKASSRAPSKAASLVSSILGRDAKSHASKNDDDFIDDLEIEEASDDDMDTVVPSDSISQIGSSRKHRSHKSKKHSDGSVVSKASHSSKSSKHSHRSHRSHKSKHDDSDETASHHSSESKSRRSHRPSVVSEPSDASTIKPVKKSSSRKDSVTHGQYDNLFDQVQYGHGDVAVRGITPSMVDASGKNNNRTMVNYGHAQKARMFED